MAEQQMKVAANLQQDFTVSQKAQARKNIDAADNKGYVTCYLPYSDSSWTDVWYKLCELEPGQSNSYSYHYELSMKLICTNNGDGDCPAESAQIDIGCNFIPRLNVGRCECTFADHTVSDHDQQTILGIKILTHRASSNYGPRDKAEVWVKCSKYFTSETQMRVECLMNSGAQFYRSNYSTPTAYTLPWVFRNTTITGTHTDPFNDASHPAAEGYGAEGWSEVWYPAETKTVMVDHPQTFTDTEKAQARSNIGAAASTDVTNKSEIKVYEGTSTVHKNLMTIYEDSTTGAMAGVNFNNANSKVTMVKKPVAGDGGKVLTVSEPGGSVNPYYEWKEMPFPAVVKTYHSGVATSYTWKFTGISSNYSKAAVTITGLEPNKLHTVEFSMEYTQNYAESYYMFVFASASESNIGVPTGYARTSIRLGDPVDGMTPRLINCSWTLNSSANGEIFINIVGNADSDNATNRVTLNLVNYTVTRLK